MKNKMTGWKKILKFTYVQSMKSKAMIITMLILCVMALLSMPVTSIIGNSSDEEDVKTKISKVYWYDDTEVIGEYFAGGKIDSDIYGNIEYERAEENSKEYINDIINKKDNKDQVFLEITYVDDMQSLSYGVNIVCYYSTDSDVDSSDAEEFAYFVEENTKRAILMDAGVDKENIDKASKNVEYKIVNINEDGTIDDTDDSIDMFQYYLTLMVICVLIFVVSLVGGKVAELIVTEKATRVMEYILTSVKPLAILVGKVIGSTLIVLTMLMGVLISFILSLFINTAMFGKAGDGIILPDIVKQLVDNGAVAGMTPLNILLIIILILSGCIFFGFIAGIAGATVSKVEEMSEGMKLFTFVMTIGAYLPLFMAMSQSISGDGWGNLSYVVYLLPISSLFILPQYLLLGKVSSGLVCGAIGVEIISLIIVVLLVNKVYEHMLYSNGEKLTVKDIIRFAKQRKEKANE